MSTEANKHPLSRWLDADQREELGDAFDVVFTALSFAFLALLVLELAATLPDAWVRRVQLVQWAIWFTFALEFVTRLALAPDRHRFLRHNWLAALSVALPALRIFRAARAIRAARSLRVVRLVTGTNRGMQALRSVAGFGGIGYVFGLTGIVLILAAAGLYSLESAHADSPIDSWGAALWWSATTLATLGSADYPVTTEGRILGLLVMMYGLAVSGYVTAVMAVGLLGLRERRDPQNELIAEIRALRQELDKRMAQEGST